MDHPPGEPQAAAPSSAPALGRPPAAAARPRTRGSSRSAAPTCACVPSAATSSAGSIYPVPDPRLPFLGVHLTRHVDGEVLVGPTALLSPARDAYRLRDACARDLADALRWPGTWRMARRFWRTGMAELRYAASRRALVAPPPATCPT